MGNRWQTSTFNDVEYEYEYLDETFVCESMEQCFRIYIIGKHEIIKFLISFRIP